LAWLRENQLGPLNDEERSAPQGHINEFSTAHFAQLEDLLLEQEAEQEATEAEESTSIALIDRDADERASEAPTGNAEDKQARELSALWSKLRQRYFPDRNDLDSYQVVWSSRRHTGTLASCSTDKRRVRVAGILNCEDAHEILEPLIYHEMCHAVLGGPIIRGGRRIFHGAEFKALERQHPEIKKLNAWIKAGNWERLVRSQKLRPR
ncbi:MAG: SprT-like domain-containing protein, partial [Bdellovibrionales bacterium]|nr:SprT-like domain-containing protein [Bdellovibrionales bacterium]